MPVWCGTDLVWSVLQIIGRGGRVFVSQSQVPEFPGFAHTGARYMPIANLMQHPHRTYSAVPSTSTVPKNRRHTLQCEPRPMRFSHRSSLPKTTFSGHHGRLH
jgi:hypothetical protein